MSSSSSRVSSAQGQRSATLSKSLKCKYCERWFKNASGRTKHVGVYHPRGEADLRRAFEADVMPPLQRMQPSSEEYEGGPLDGIGFTHMDIDGDMDEHINRGMLSRS
jgi:hypothetical protein